MSQSSETYFVYVHGSGDNSMGEFQISLVEFNVTEPNSFCNEAISLAGGSELVLQGSTENATRTPTIQTCGVENANRGLWYTFDGTGYPFEIDACKSNETDGNFDVSFSLYSGGNCGELQCVAGVTFNEQVCGRVDDQIISSRFLEPANFTSSNSPTSPTPDQTMIDSEAGVTYYLFVHGEGLSPVGELNVTIRSLAPPSAAPTEAPEKSIPPTKFINGKAFFIIMLAVSICAVALLCICCRKTLYPCCYKAEVEGDLSKSQSERDLEQTFQDEHEAIRPTNSGSSSSYSNVASNSVSNASAPETAPVKRHRWQTLD